MTNLSIRTIFTENKLLDTLRINFLTWFYSKGIKSLCNSFDPVHIVTPGALPYLEECKPAIFAIYHGRMHGLISLSPLHKLTVLVSQSRDGEIIARALHNLGLSLARGSHGRKGIQGAREFINAGKSGQRLVYTVDGPRGPAYKVKPGVIRMASILGVPIIPFVCQARHNWWMRSWDEFMVSDYWSTCFYMFNDPVIVCPNVNEQEQETLRLLLENKMDAMRQYLQTIIQKL